MEEDFLKDEQISPSNVQDRVLCDIGMFLEAMGKNISEYELPKPNTISAHSGGVLKEILEEMNAPISGEDTYIIQNLNYE
ncbi:hypothetical protein QJS04_geneDACA017273 [Acorus gramineus]|uniref:Uncharacterized protein n=1 Tax=Acorus gramineus TaxID=55184 RepID=A0AAV9A2S3_ACOGR|nr:hypothetical protein QJS04_geneDACA017273 [Acorus gramineus]